MTTTKKSAKRTAKPTAKKAKQAERVSSLNRLITRVGLLFIAIGLIIGGISIYNNWHGQQSTVKPEPVSSLLNSSAASDNGDPLISGAPVHITINNVGIDLNVIPGYYYPSTKSWTLTSTNAQYGTITAKANNKSGATFIYGHALMNVFGKLPKVQPGDTAVIKTDSGHTFVYKFQKSSVVTPDNTSLFKYKGPPVLILQTCTGAWYQNRQLFVFNFSEVS
jgi:LPXTG-site transpeptidase (sortase) family protein